MPVPNALSLKRLQWAVAFANARFRQLIRTMANGHQLKCHLDQSVLDEMTPVIKLAAEFPLDIDQRHPHFAGVFYLDQRCHVFQNARAALLRGYLCQSGVKTPEGYAEMAAAMGEIAKTLPDISWDRKHTRCRWVCHHRQLLGKRRGDQRMARTRQTRHRPKDRQRTLVRGLHPARGQGGTAVLL